MCMNMQVHVFVFIYNLSTIIRYILSLNVIYLNNTKLRCLNILNFHCNIKQAILLYLHIQVYNIDI